jgi:hypothetical protein
MLNNEVAIAPPDVRHNNAYTPVKAAVIQQKLTILGI